MKIEQCEFPDDLLYDPEGLVWARISDPRNVVVGITSIHAAVTGPIVKVTAKPLDVGYARGAAIGLMESGRFFGPVRSPFSGVLREVNSSVLANPRTMTDAPYSDGWFGRVRPSHLDEDRKALRSAKDARGVLAKQIATLRVRCFAAFPDYEMFEIGIECSAILAKLNELLTRIGVGEVVHLVTDDPTSPIEMVRWSDQTGQPVIDERKEGNLFHFLVRKVT